MRGRRKLTERDEFGRLLILIAVVFALAIAGMVFGDRSEPEQPECKP